MAQAREAFYQQAVTAESLVTLRDLYLAWSDAAVGHYLVYRRLAGALGRLGRSTYQGRAIPSASDHLQPPTFTEALNAAIARVISRRIADAEDAAVQRILDIESGEIDG